LLVLLPVVLQLLVLLLLVLLLPEGACVLTLLPTNKIGIGEVTYSRKVLSPSLSLFLSRRGLCLEDLYSLMQHEVSISKKKKLQRHELHFRELQGGVRRINGRHRCKARIAMPP
jgi:hypothetical protein